MCSLAYSFWVASDYVREGVPRLTEKQQGQSSSCPTDEDTRERKEVSSGCSVSNRERGPILHGGGTVLIHPKNLSWSHPFKPETWRGRLEGWSHHQCLLHSFKHGWEASENLSPLQMIICPPPASVTTQLTICILSTYLHVFLGPFSLQLYFLNEAIASTDSGEFVFPTRALKLMKFSGLIFNMKSKRTKKGVSTFSRWGF